MLISKDRMESNSQEASCSPTTPAMIPSSLPHLFHLYSQHYGLEAQSLRIIATDCFMPCVSPGHMRADSESGNDLDFQHLTSPVNCRCWTHCRQVSLVAAEMELLEGQQKSSPLRWPLGKSSVRIWGRNQAGGPSGLWAFHGCLLHRLTLLHSGQKC